MGTPVPDWQSLPDEIQVLLRERIGTTALRPEITRILRPGIVYEHTDEIERKAPRVFNQRLSYFAKLGYWYGIERTIGTKIADEGTLDVVLEEVGKRGDSRMIHFLLQHGAANLQPAIVAAILSHQNGFVREWIDRPSLSLLPYVLATMKADNLEILRFIAPRLNGNGHVVHLRTNRTSYWFYCFNQITEFYQLDFGGFGTDNTIRPGDAATVTRLLGALASDLPEPLPFSYAQLERLTSSYVRIVKNLVTYIVTGISKNYTRIEWFLDAAHRRGDFTINRREERREWIDAFLPLIRDPKASNILRKAEEYLGAEWTRLFAPVVNHNDPNISSILTLMKPWPGYVEYFDPVQPYIRKMWLDMCITSASERWVEAGLEWVLNNYPNRDESMYLTSDKYRYPKPDPMGIDLQNMIVEFFKIKPLETLAAILEHRQLDLWNELAPWFDPSTPQRELLYQAAYDMGLNQLVDIFRNNYPPMEPGKGLRYFRVQDTLGRVRYSLHLPNPRTEALIPQVEDLFASKQQWLNDRLAGIR